MLLKPNYHGGSILNLVASIEKGLGGKPFFASAALLSPLEVSAVQNVVLMVIDGLGFEFLRQHGKKTVFWKHLRGKLTSIFPSSTSAAIPSLMTGRAPQEHGMLGWYMFLHEFGSTIIPLPYVLRAEKTVSLGSKIPIQSVFRLEPLADRLDCESFLVEHLHYVHSDFSKATGGKSTRISFRDRKGFFKSVQQVVSKKSRKKRFVFAYYDQHDTLCHEFGVGSKEVLAHFKQLEKDFVSFVESISGSNSLLLVTADHGLTNVVSSKAINLNHHPFFLDCLSVPPFGEHRFVYCLVRPAKKKAFVEYVKKHFGSACQLFRSDVFAKKGFFGLSSPHPQFYNRIGDYILLAKDGWGFDYKPPYSKPDHHVGHHGGLSKEELWVPLVVIKT